MNKWRDLMCGDVRPEHVGQRPTLAGWADVRRDHGGLIFIDLRDRSGLTQLVVNPERAPEAAESAHGVRNEFVLVAEGEVVRRAPEADADSFARRWRAAGAVGWRRRRQRCSAAKNSSAVFVFGCWSAERLRPSPSRYARASTPAWNASPGRHFVESSRILDPSG